MPPRSPYAAPSSHASASTNPDVDIVDAATPTSAKVGGSVVLFAGLIFTLMALQTFALITLRGVMVVTPALLLFLGLVMLFCGVSLFRARGWAALVSLLVSSVAALVALVWLLLCLVSGILGLFALSAPPLALAGIVAGAVNLGPCRRASEARERLAAAGLGFGL